MPNDVAGRWDACWSRCIGAGVCRWDARLPSRWMGDAGVGGLKLKQMDVDVDARTGEINAGAGR